MNINMDKLTFSTHTRQDYNKPATPNQLRVRGLRGATTVSDNSAQAITEAVDELLDALELNNSLDPTEIVSVTFSVTSDLDAIFPASVARHRQGWQDVPLLDVQQMHVVGGLDHCIRLLIHLNTALPQNALRHLYLRGAVQLRPDLALAV